MDGGAGGKFISQSIGDDFLSCVIDRFDFYACVQCLNDVLWERLTDIPLLVHAFLGQFRSVMEKPVLQVSPDALQVLINHSWPGNVRELKSAVESALIHCKGTVVRVEDLPPEVQNPEPAATYVHFKRQDERTRMVGALQQTGVIARKQHGC